MRIVNKAMAAKLEIIKSMSAVDGFEADICKNIEVKQKGNVSIKQWMVIEKTFRRLQKNPNHIECGRVSALEAGGDTWRLYVDEKQVGDSMHYDIMMPIYCFLVTAVDEIEQVLQEPAPNLGDDDGNKDR